MNPLNKEQKQNIFERLSFLEVEFKDLNKYKDLDWNTYSKDRDIQRNAERIIENIANASIDICKIALAGETVEIPNTSREIILKAGELGIIEKDLSSRIASLAKVRNVLAHQYLDLKWDLIKNSINEVPQIIPQFIGSFKMG